MPMPSALAGLRAALASQGIGWSAHPRRAALGAPSRPPNRLRLIGLRAWRRCALRLRGAGADVELLSLLALCVGFTVSAITSREGERPAALLAQAVGLDMGQWWTPTAAGYFEHVSKAKALEAVQVFAPGEVHRLGKLKKAQIAAEAERLAAGSGWLPAMFRVPEAVTETAAVPAEAREDAAVPADNNVDEAEVVAEAA